MSEQMPIQLSDESIERMLRDRAGGGAPEGLTAAIVRAVGDTRQRRRSWLGMLGLREGSRYRLVLVAGLLALLLIAAAIALVGSRLQADRRVAPPPPSPSNAAVATHAPSPSPTPASSPSAEPTASPEPTTSPTGLSGTCSSTPPADTPRVTVVDLPADAYQGVSFAGCATWVTNNANGRGIHKVDLASNTVVRTVMKGPIESPIVALRSDTDELWVLDMGQRVRLERIDPATGKPDRSVDAPPGSLDGGMWILGGQAWVGPHRYSRGRNTVRVVDLETGATTATIEDVAPIDMWRDGSTVWALARKRGAPRSGTGADDLDLVRFDPRTFAVTRLPLSSVMTDQRFRAASVAGSIYLGAPGEVRQISSETGEVVRRIPVAHADIGVMLVSTESRLWALPIEGTAVSHGSDNRSRQLLEIDPATGDIMRRVPLLQRSPMDLVYGYGSLWILAPDDDYLRTFGTHLIRVELPSGG